MELATARRRARAWKNIATSATMRRIAPDWVPEPHAGHFIVTFKCNLKCVGCGSWKVRDHDDLSTEEWRAVFRQMRQLDLVKILGGEPFVRRDLRQILEAVREESDPYILQLATNGMLTDRVVDVVEAIAWPGLQLRISVDGTEATHDELRGVKGSWKKVAETCRQVAKIRERKDFNFGINFAVNDVSIPDVEPMLRFAEELGADLVPGMWVDPFLVGTVPPEVKAQQVIMISDKQKAADAMRDARMGLKGQLPVVDRVLSRFLVDRTFTRQLNGDVKRFTCRELRDLLYMLPNGDVVRCGLDHEKIGNVREQSFHDIWHGQAIRPYRKKVDDCSGCFQASVQIMSRLYGGCLDA